MYASSKGPSNWQIWEKALFVTNMPNVSQSGLIDLIPGSSTKGVLQNLNRKKTHHHAHFSPRSSPPSLMSDSLTMAATSFPATTLQSRSGMSIWNDNQ
jgi:hypothetical protein